MFPSLVPCTKFTLRNVAAKKIMEVSLILKDSDTESENLSSLIQFRECIIYRYIIKASIT